MPQTSHPVYYQIDQRMAIAYPEQFMNVRYLEPADGDETQSRSLYAISMAIMDPTPFFDPMGKFTSNIFDIAGLGDDRSKNYNANKEPFDLFYSAGMRIKYDEYLARNYGVRPPVLCFDFTVDLAKDDRPIGERLSPVAIKRDQILPQGIFTFDSFSEKLPHLETKSEDSRLHSANKFVEDIKQLPDILNECRWHASKEKNMSLGNLYAASVSYMTKASLAMHAYDKEQEKMKFPLLTNIFMYAEDTGERATFVVTLQDYSRLTSRIGLARATAPLSDMAAAYNLLEIAKAVDGKRAHGYKEAAKAACRITSCRMPQVSQTIRDIMARRKHRGCGKGPTV